MIAALAAGAARGGCFGSVAARPAVRAEPRRDGAAFSAASATAARSRASTWGTRPAIHAGALRRADAPHDDHQRHARPRAHRASARGGHRMFPQPVSRRGVPLAARGDVALLCAGTEGEVSAEDVAFAGALACELAGTASR